MRPEPLSLKSAAVNAATPLVAPSAAALVPVMVRVLLANAVVIPFEPV